MLHVIDLPKTYDALKDDILNNGAKNVYHFEDYTPDFSDTRKRYEVGFRKDKELVNKPV